jgi:hemolysin III
MSVLTDSIRLTEMGPLFGGYQPSQAVAVTATHVHPVELDPVFPGQELIDKLATALTRPATASRTTDEERVEERLNTVTHGLGLAASAVAVAYLLSYVAAAGDLSRVASCAVYGVTLVLMYASSTSLHAAQQPKLKRRFQLCDHVSIYLLIAGTYTPFLATLMQGVAGYSLLACVWLLAAAGIAMKVINADRLGETPVWPCLALGWLIILALKPLLAAMPIAGVWLLVAGGISYSIGMLFYCRDDKRCFHAIWHAFVIAGTAFHFVAVLLYVAI